MSTKACSHAFECEHCTCTWGTGSLGRLYGVNMGEGRIRLTTAKGCPVHEACRGFTQAARAGRPDGAMLYCPRHRTKDCPSADRTAVRL